MIHARPPKADRLTTDDSWIDEITDAECMDVFWLYVDPPEPFLEAHSSALLGAAMRYALRAIAQSHTGLADVRDAR